MRAGRLDEDFLRTTTKAPAAAYLKSAPRIYRSGLHPGDERDSSRCHRWIPAGSSGNSKTKPWVRSAYHQFEGGLGCPDECERTWCPKPWSMNCSSSSGCEARQAKQSSGDPLLSETDRNFNDIRQQVTLEQNPGAANAAETHFSAVRSPRFSDSGSRTKWQFRGGFHSS